MTTRTIRAHKPPRGKFLFARRCDGADTATICGLLNLLIEYDTDPMAGPKPDRLAKMRYGRFETGRQGYVGFWLYQPEAQAVWNLHPDTAPFGDTIEPEDVHPCELFKKAGGRA